MSFCSVPAVSKDCILFQHYTMAGGGISPYNRSLLSYKIVIDPTSENVSWEDRFEKWVQANPLLALLATALFFGSVR